MTNYKKLLLEQYKNSQGIKTNDTESKIFMIDFIEWITESKKIGEKYTDFLEELDVPFTDSTCAEVGKSTFDSVVLPYETTIITPHIEGLESLEESRVMEATFEVIDATPIIYIPSKAKPSEVIEVPKSVITRFMTQNPYSQDHIASWNDLHNQFEYDITVGVFGSINDKDIDKKIKQLQILRDNLTRELVEEYIEDNGNYYYVLASKRKVKKLKNVLKK